MHKLFISLLVLLFISSNSMACISIPDNVQLEGSEINVQAHIQKGIILNGKDTLVLISKSDALEIKEISSQSFEVHLRRDQYEKAPLNTNLEIQSGKKKHAISISYSGQMQKGGCGGALKVEQKNLKR